MLRWFATQPLFFNVMTYPFLHDLHREWGLLSICDHLSSNGSCELPPLEPFPLAPLHLVSFGPSALGCQSNNLADS
jgi:hypothetical protein